MGRWYNDQHTVTIIKRQKCGCTKARILDLLKECSVHGQMVQTLTKVKIQPGL